MNRAYRLSLSALAAGSALLSVAARAETPTPVAGVIVSATRLPSPLEVTPDAYVIDDKQIEATQATFASQVLATVPGLSVFSNGMFGLTSIRMRGASSDKTLVLIDGVPVNDASQPEGSFDFAGLDLADVSRIEVLSGPQASLWGSDAIGGVISFTTREPDGVRADFEGGSFGTTRISGAVGRSTDRWALGLTASDFASQGVSAADSRNGNSEPDGFRDLTLGARGRVVVNDAITLDSQLRYMKSRTDLDGYPPPNFVLGDTNDVARSEGTLGFVRAEINGPFGVHHELSFSDDHLKRGDTGQSGDFGYTADRQVYRWTQSFGAVADPLSVESGVEFENDDASISTGDHVSLSNLAVFALGRWRPVAPLTVTGAVRYDKPNHYQGVTTGRIAAVYELGAGFSLSASAGQGFKTPTISETVCDFCFPSGPSVGLRPEHAEGYDAGVGWRSGDGRYALRVTGYGLDIRDEIAYSSVFPFRYINLARTRSRGAELEGEAALRWGFRLKASYSYTDAKDIAAAGQPPQRASRVPLNSGSASLLWAHGPADAALSLRSEGDQVDTGLDGFSPVTRPGFSVVDLAGGYALTDHVRVTARIENLADTHYQQVFGYGEPGRAVYVGIHFKD
jgi:vitamin B12 transporter